MSGYTFALAGEPDLDRVIRLQHPVAPRSHGPEVGVAVTSVVLDGKTQRDHLLVGARLELLDEPRFESRNLLLTDDRGGAGLIDPFHLRIAEDGLMLRRKDVLYRKNPDARLHEMPVAVLNRRAPVDLDGMRMDPIRIAYATGITDPVEYRRERRDALAAELRQTTHPEMRAALQKRLRELEIDEAGDIRLLTLNAVQTRRFDLNGPTEVRGEIDPLGRVVDAASEWPIEFWMGAWDADALCGYMRGLLTVPLRRPDHGATGSRPRSG